MMDVFGPKRPNLLILLNTEHESNTNERRKKSGEDFVSLTPLHRPPFCPAGTKGVFGIDRMKW